jgi:hypothetical protein
MLWRRYGSSSSRWWGAVERSNVGREAGAAAVAQDPGHLANDHHGDVAPRRLPHNGLFFLVLVIVFNGM